MKKNDWILLISVFTYSFLFYEQNAGINFLIFNLLLVGAFAIINHERIKNKDWMVVALGSIITSACIMYYSSPLAIIGNIISLSLLSVLSFAPATSVFTSMIMTAVSIGMTPVSLFFDWVQRSKKSQQKSSRTFVGIIVSVIIFLVIVLFFFMYQSSSPLFKDFTKDINLDFISWSWVFFTLGGFLLMYPIFYYHRLGAVSKFDSGISGNLIEDAEPEKKFLNRILKLNIEFVSGIVLFGILNLMLLILNVLDLNYLWFDGKLPEGIQHRQFVHDGIGVLITSLICAILIILFYFRGRLNYYPKNKFLKALAYLWILQNIFMIFSNAYRNNMYIEDAGISYKKIGVYVYLGLTLIGLITTFIKVSKLKSNMFLFRVNPWCYYLILVISAMFNWDMIITDFNINKALKENKKLEKYYLVDLSFKNLPQLLLLHDSIKSYDDLEARDYYYSLKGTFFSSFNLGLDGKLYNFLKEMQNPGWPSYCSEKNRVINEIIALNEKKLIKKIDLRNNYIQTASNSKSNLLEPLKVISNLEILYLDNNYLNKLDGISYFPNLKTLSLNSNAIDSLEKLPMLNALNEFYLSNNPIFDLSGLKNVPNIQTLDISNIKINNLNTFPALKKLSYLNLSGNTITDFSELTKCESLDNLSIGATFKGKIDSFPALSRLTILDLHQNLLSDFISNNFAKFFGGCKNLKDLNLSDNGLTYLTYIIPAIETKNEELIFPNLEVLQLGYNRLVATYGIEKWKNLKELYLSSNTITTVSNLFSLSELKTLYLDNNRINNIEGVENLTKLQSLNISGCGVRTGIKLLANLKNMKELRASANNISSITPFLNSKNLTTLDLSDNKIKEIKGIEQLYNLEALWIDKNSISDFTPLFKLKKLKTLVIDLVPEILLQKLKKELPNCTVTYTNRP